MCRRGTGSASTSVSPAAALFAGMAFVAEAQAPNSHASSDPLDRLRHGILLGMTPRCTPTSPSGTGTVSPNCKRSPAASRRHSGTAVRSERGDDEATIPSADSATEPRVRPDRAAAGRRVRDERGLTTLEWLLIVAAVAGIAALAVVLVQNVVSDVSEQVAGSNARYVAAQLAGDQIQVEARRPTEDQPRTIEDWDDWERHYETKCKRLRITYGDAGVEAKDIEVAFKKPPSGEYKDDILKVATDAEAKAGIPQAKCLIKE